jgi:hypothetical protein
MITKAAESRAMQSCFVWNDAKRGPGLGRMLAGLLLAFASFAAVAGTVGKIDEFSGPVRLLDLEGKERAAAKGGEVREGDRISTAENGRVQVRLSDGGYLSVRPNTELVFKRYVLNETIPAQSSFWVSLLKGGFRSITGMIGRINPAGYRIETGTATIGVRGTDHEPFYIPAPGPGERAPGEPGTYDKLNSGRSYIETPKAVLDLKPGQVGFAPRLDQAPRLLPRAPDFFREQPAVPRQYLGRSNAPGASGGNQQAAADQASTGGSAAVAAPGTQPEETAPATIVLTPTTSILAPSTNVLDAVTTSQAAHSPSVAVTQMTPADTNAAVPLADNTPAPTDSASPSSIRATPADPSASDQAASANSQAAAVRSAGNASGNGTGGGGASPNGNSNGQAGPAGTVASPGNANRLAPSAASTPADVNGNATGGGNAPTAASGPASQVPAASAPGNGIGNANGIGNGNKNGPLAAAPGAGAPATPSGQGGPPAGMNASVAANPAGKVPSAPANGNVLVNGMGGANAVTAPAPPPAAPAAVSVPIPATPAGNIPGAPTAAGGPLPGGGKPQSAPPQSTPPQSGPKPQPVSVPAPAGNPGNAASKKT